MRNELKRIAEELKADEGESIFPAFNYVLNAESKATGKRISHVCAQLGREDNENDSSERIKHSDIGLLLDYIADLIEL